MEGLEHMDRVLQQAFQHCERSQAAWDRLKAFGQLRVKGDPEHVSRLTEEFCGLSQRIEMTLTAMVESVEVLHSGAQRPGERATTPDAAEALTALQGMEGDEEADQKEPSLLAEPRELLDASDDDPPIDPLDGIHPSQYGIQYTAEEMEDGEDTDAGGSSESNEEMPDVKKCNCKKSRCLKLYCECFSSGIFCESACMCRECLNVVQFTALVTETRQHILDRSPNAFAPKVSSAGGHKKGCHCKKSRCLKKYCECYQANVPCTDACRCENCKNTGPGAPRDESPQESFFERGAPPLTCLQNALTGSQGKGQEGGSSSGSLHKTPQTKSAQCAPSANPIVCNIFAQTLTNPTGRRAHPVAPPAPLERRRLHPRRANPSKPYQAAALAPQGSGTLDATSEAYRREHSRLAPQASGGYTEMLIYAPGGYAYHTPRVYAEDVQGRYYDSPCSAVEANDMFHMPLSTRRAVGFLPVAPSEGPSHLMDAHVKQEQPMDFPSRVPCRARSQRSLSRARQQAFPPEQHAVQAVPTQPRVNAQDWAPTQAIPARPSLLAAFTPSGPTQDCYTANCLAESPAESPADSPADELAAGALPLDQYHTQRSRLPEPGSLADIRAGLTGCHGGFKAVAVQENARVPGMGHCSEEEPIGSAWPDSANTTSAADKASHGIPAQALALDASYSGAWESKAPRQQDWACPSSPGRAWASMTTETSSGGTDTADDAISPPPPLTSRQAAAKTSAAIMAGYQVPQQQRSARPPRAKRSNRAPDEVEQQNFQRPRVVSWGTAPAAPEQQRDLRWHAHPPMDDNYRMHGVPIEPVKLGTTWQNNGGAAADVNTSPPEQRLPEILGEAQVNGGKGTEGFRETLGAWETLDHGRKPLISAAKGLPSLLPAKSAPGKYAPNSKQIGKENHGHKRGRKLSSDVNEETAVIAALLELDGGF